MVKTRNIGKKVFAKSYSLIKIKVPKIPTSKLQTPKQKW